VDASLHEAAPSQDEPDAAPDEADAAPDEPDAAQDPPILAAGHATAFQWAEFATTLALTAGGWVVADSYRGVPWITVRKL
jgi:hypothetical protein